jgi:RNA polymerase sigma-70 factor (ECF subfamily)
VARFFRKRGGRRVVPFDPQTMPGPTVEPAESSHDARVDVHRAMKELAPEHREVIVLREFHGMAYDEIAEALDVPQGTVESRLWRARKALAELLKEYLD